MSADGRPDADAESAPVLPEAVRRRIGTLTAESLRTLQPAQVPGGLRAAQRWRAGALPKGFAEKVLAAISADEDFRRRIGAVLADADDLGRSVARGEHGPADDPVAVSALLYLIRPDSWSDRMAGVLDALAAGSTDPAREAARLRDEVAALKDRLARQQRSGEARIEEAGAALSIALAESRADDERLRRQLSQAQQDLAAARSQTAAAQRQAGESERELRRMRAQRDEAVAAAGQTRTVAKDARILANARAKVLIEVLQEAAAGLSQELVVPPGTPEPADLVDAAAPAAATAAKRLLTAADLAQALTLPRCHLIVDGYNVTKGVWPNAPLLQQRERLIAALAALASRTGADITVVFDGADVGGVPAATSRNVRVRFSARGELADRVIVRLVDAEPPGRPVVAVTSDAAVAAGARAAGARTAESAVLTALMPAGR